MATLTPSWLRWTAALATGLFLGCAPEAADDEAEEMSPEALSVLGLVVPKVPAGIDLCAGATGVSLPNASWLSWFAANAYAHLNVLAPALRKHGFGNDGDAAAWAAEFSLLKAAVTTGDSRAANLEKALVQTVHADRAIDFFSAGHLILDREKKVVFEKGSTQVTWAKHRSLPLVVIAFRGTEGDERDDILADIDVRKVDAPVGGRVHRGFARGAESVEPFLRTRLAALPPGQTVLVTGHSLGGAVATAFVAKVLTLGLPQRFSLYTFGSPRVGNQEFVEAFEAKATTANATIARFQNGKDPVTAQPFDWVGFAHAGIAVDLGPERMELEATRDPSWFNAFEDHTMLAYYERVTVRAMQQRPAYAVTGQGAHARTTLADLKRCDSR